MHRVLLITSLLLVSLVACHEIARADIEFDSSLAKAQTKESAEPVEIVYSFKNTGTTPVSISRVRVSCGCMSAKQQEQTYQPGETGEVRVWFNPAGRNGLQRRGVSVHVLDGDNKKKHLLGLEVMIE